MPWNGLRVSAVLRTLPILEVVDLLVGLLLQLGNFVGELSAICIRRVFGFGGLTVVRGACGIFHVAPRLLRRALYLVGYALIGELLVADCLTYLLFCLADTLIEFSRYAVLIHLYLLEPT